MEQLGLRDELKRCASYLYTDDPAYVERLEQEAEACRLLDLPVSVTVETELPFPVLTAVRMDGQARIHPLRFADALARWLVEKGVGSIPTPAPIPPKRTRRPGISGPTGAPCMRTRSFSPPITLSWIKAASILPGSGRSAPMSLALTRVPPDGASLLGTGESGFPSARPRGQRAAGEVQGLPSRRESHKTGHEGTRYHYEALRTAARSWYPDMRVAGRWSAQDGMTHDSVPYIGRYRQLGWKAGRPGFSGHRLQQMGHDHQHGGGRYPQRVHPRAGSSLP